MEEPIWVREGTVTAIHLRQLSEHGGLSGVRDAGLLESALARPKNLWSYLEKKPDLAALAAAYAHGIAKNHPFLDGNKRTAFVTSETFLNLNNRFLGASPEERYSTFLRLAEGGLSEDELAAWIRSRLTQ